MRFRAWKPLCVSRLFFYLGALMQRLILAIVVLWIVCRVVGWLWARPVPWAKNDKHGEASGWMPDIEYETGWHRDGAC